MSFRSLLLGLGVLLVAAGFVLTVAWFNQMSAPAPTPPVAEAPKPEIRMSSILVATRDVPRGSQLQLADVNWKEVPLREVRPGFVVQGQTPESDYLGAITQRDIASGAAIGQGDFIKVSEQRGVAASLTRDKRAVTMAFEPPQSPFGLTSSSAFALPGDHVDVILTQQLETPGEPGRRLLGETILRDVKVIGVDRTMGGMARNLPEDMKAVRGEAALGPRTITFEVKETEAQALFVGSQLGRLHLSVRPAVDTDRDKSDARRLPSTWAVDVSPSLLDVPPKQAANATGSSIESSIRRLPSPVH